MINNTNNFGVYGTSLPHFIHTIDTSNRVGDRPLYYWVNQTDKSVPKDAGYVAIINSTRITIRDLTVRANYQGLLLAYTSDSIVQNISAVGNQYGFYLDYSNSNTVSSNVVQLNSFRGVYLYNSNSNVIIDNRLAVNTDTGLKLDWHSDYNTISNNQILYNELGISLNFSDNNRIHHNSFVNNTFQTINANGTSTWNDELNKGNYWSDYNGTDADHDGIGDSPYIIDSSNADNYPLIHPWGFALLQSDLNQDGIVNIIDITIAATAFASRPGDSKWNPLADLDKNDIINIVDVTLVAKDYGKRV